MGCQDHRGHRWRFARERRHAMSPNWPSLRSRSRFATETALRRNRGRHRDSKLSQVEYLSDYYSGYRFLDQSVNRVLRAWTLNLRCSFDQ